MPIIHKFTGTNIALVAVGAALVSVSTIWGGYPLGGVAITLQTFAILLVGAVLGAYRGAAAVLIYLALGTAGVPVFSGHTGGTAIWSGTKAGFLVSFVIAAFVTGWIAERLAAKRLASFAGFLGATLVGAAGVVGVLGWGYLGWKLKMPFTDLFSTLAPFVPGDIIKAFLAAAVAIAVYRAFPQILAPAVTVSTTVATSASVATAAAVAPAAKAAAKAPAKAGAKAPAKKTAPAGKK